MFYEKKNGKESYAAKFKVAKVFVHPKYDGSPTCGYDIGFAVLDMDSMT